MANWKHNGKDFFLHVEDNSIYGRVTEDKETDRSAVGWRAYALGEPRPIAKDGRLAHHLIRRMEPVGYFRRLRDAMQHVRVL